MAPQQIPRKILVLYEHDLTGTPYPSAYIRLIGPFQQAEFLAHFDPVFTMSLPASFEGVACVVCERLWRPRLDTQIFDRLLRECRSRNIPLIYTLDDNLLDIGEFSEADTFPRSIHRTSVARLVRSADAVVVSTDSLARRILHHNRNIHIIRNALLPERYLRNTKAEAPSGSLTIGYMGTATHQKDFLMVLPALKAIIKNSAEKVRLELIGISQFASRFTSLFPPESFTLLDIQHRQSYPDFIAWLQQTLSWDIGIAPLVDNQLNDCKSDLKHLEYSLWKIPAIYSEVSAYRHTVVHEKTGLLTTNTESGWHSQLKRLIADRQLRQELAQKAQAEVLLNRPMDACAIEWVNLISRLRVQRGSVHL